MVWCDNLNFPLPETTLHSCFSACALSLGGIEISDSLILLSEMATERATITPEPASSSGAPLTPPSEAHSASAKSPRVVQSQVVEVEQTPLQAISHGILMDGNHNSHACFRTSLILAGKGKCLHGTGIPTFDTYEEHRRQILIHMAATFRDWSKKGFCEGQSGHISVRDPEFEHCIWMNPLGRHFGLMTAGDFICLDVFTGAVVGGNNVSELQL